MKGLAQKFAGSPVWPALLSALVVPGAGQIFNREYKKGLFLVVTSVLAFMWFMKTITERAMMVLKMSADQIQQDPDALALAVATVFKEAPDMFLTFYALFILLWGFSVIDAYLIAKKPLPAAKGSDESSDLDR